MHASDLHVVSCYNNFRRFASRPRLARQWIKDTLDSGVSLTFVELAVGERAFEFSTEELPHVNLVQLRVHAGHELWLRDAAVMAGISRLPETAKYICWEDADIRHLRSDWAMETLHMLQLYRVGQTWTHSFDFDPHGNIAPNEWNNDIDRSFCAAWTAGDVEIVPGNYSPTFAQAMLAKDRKRDWRSHTGYSWAIRRDTLNGIGRLIDWMVTGSSDYHMALGFCGKLRQMVHNSIKDGGEEKYSKGYYRRLLEFADRCDEHVRQDIGVVPGIVGHGWHSSKKLRFYGAREAILTESHFDPDKDLAVDMHGLPYLSRDNRILRDGLRRYQQLRNEDSVDLK